mgnify:CR=1 FL=1
MRRQLPNPLLNHSNQVWLHGELTEKQALRHTPAGVPTIEAVLGHLSEQSEAGLTRRVECLVQIVALGKTAERLSRVPAGTKLAACGFLAAKSLRRRHDLVLHVEEFELLN